MKVGLKQSFLESARLFTSHLQKHKNDRSVFLGHGSKIELKRAIRPHEIIFNPLQVSVLTCLSLKVHRPVTNLLSLKEIQQAISPCIFGTNRGKYLNLTKEIATKALADQRGLLAHFRKDPNLSEKISCAVHQLVLNPGPKQKLLEMAIGKFTKECVGFVEQQALYGLLQDPNLIAEDLTKTKLEKICPQLLVENPDLPLHLETQRGRQAALEVLKGSNIGRLGIVKREQIIPVLRSFYPEVDRYKDQMRMIVALTTLISFIWFATFTSLIDPIHRPSYK